MPGYAEPQYGITKQIIYPGNAGTSLLFTPRVGTLTYTSTDSVHLNTGTVTGATLGFWKPVRIKQIVYTIKTVAASGNSANFYLYVDGTAKGTLAITTEVGTTVATSSVMNAKVEAGKAIRVDAVSITTGTNATPSGASVGILALTYQELFDNLDR